MRLLMWQVYGFQRIIDKNRSAVFFYGGAVLQLVEKVCFYKIVRILYPYPQTPFPRKGAILLGLPPLDPVGGFAPATPFLIFTKGFSTA